MWQVYAIAFVFGVVDAFFMPARESILPRVVPVRELAPGNAVPNAPAGAVGLGILFGAWGVGATAGALGSGLVPPPQRFGWLMVLLCLWLGVGIGVVGLLQSLGPAALAMGLSGIATGVVNTYGVSWLQRRTDPAIPGRVTSIV